MALGVSAGLALAVAVAAAMIVVTDRGHHAAPARDPPLTLQPNGTIEQVIDGDTVVARVDGRDEHVRLIGIDTPETVDPKRPVMCFGPEASAETHTLLPDGTPVRLVRDVEARDKYHRLLAYVYRTKDDLFVNRELAQDGFADLLTFPPNVAHVDDFTAAVREARDAGRGLWSACR